MSSELLVVFDIDETLIHFVSNRYTDLYFNLLEEVRGQFDIVRDGENIIILRPYLQELFDFYKKNPNIKVALWTYSEQEYAYNIRDILTEKLGLGEDFFLFAYGAEDMLNEDGDEDDYPKNLEKVYRDFPSFNVFNTFIVDDAPGNIKHEINKENCLLIQPFAPFSVDKVRRDLGEEGIDIALNDTILEDVENISHIVKTDISGCSIEDIEECFTDQPVFSKKRIKRMGLGKLLKKYTNPPIYELLTIGNPKQSKKFVMVAGKKKKKKKSIKKKKKSIKKKKKSIKKKKKSIKKKSIKKKSIKKKSIKKKVSWSDKVNFKNINY